MRNSRAQFVGRVGLGEAAVAVGRLVELAVVLVQDAEVVQHTLADGRVLEALLVVADGFEVVAGDVVEEAEAEVGAGVGGVEFGGALVSLGGAGGVALGLGDAAVLEVELGVVRGHVLKLGEDRLRLTGLILEPQHAGLLELHLLGRIPGLLGLLERGESVVVLTALGERTAQEERGEWAVGEFQLLDRLGHVAEVEVDHAELEVQLLGLRWLRGGEPLGECVVDFFERLDLRPALGQPLAELRDHAAFKLLASTNRERKSINVSVMESVSVFECRSLPRVGHLARTRTLSNWPKHFTIPRHAPPARRPALAPWDDRG